MLSPGRSMGFGPKSPWILLPQRGPEQAETALASAAAEIQALCDSCRAALVVKTQRLGGWPKLGLLPSGNDYY